MRERRRVRAGDLQLCNSGWWIRRSKRPPDSSPEVWKLPQIHEMSTTSCLLPSGERELWGQSAGTISITVITLGSVPGQVGPSGSSVSTRSVGGFSARRKGLFWEGSEEAHKTQYSNTDETWKNELKWHMVVLIAFLSMAILYHVYGERDLNVNKGETQCVWLQLKQKAIL